MKLNMLFINLIEDINKSPINKLEYKKIYTRYCVNNVEIMNYYFKNYLPLSDKDKENRIFQISCNIKENYSFYKSLYNYYIEENKVTEFLTDLKISNEILKELQVNVFIGLNTCHGFTQLTKKAKSINIAAEMFINEKDINKKIFNTFSHELSHMVRYESQLFPSSFTLGDMLIEEGLACLFAKNLLELKDDEINFIFPNDLSNYELEYKSLTNIYLDNFLSTDPELIQNFINLGSEQQGIIAGTGYIIGVKLVENYMKLKKCSLSEVVTTENRYIIEFILNNRLEMIL